MPLELAPFGTLTVHSGESWRLASGPRGARSVTSFDSLTWEAEGFRARAHWANGTYLAGPEIAEVNVRAMLETDDGALVYLDYVGRFVPAQMGSEGGPVYSTGRFETADERYAWLNATQAVGKGTRSGDVLTYEMYVLR